MQWYDRLAEDLEGLKFRRERPEDHEDNGISIVNSTELRAADVDVRPLVPTGLASSVYQPGTRRQPARSGRRAAVVERAAPPELPADTVYEIRADTDALIHGPRVLVDLSTICFGSNIPLESILMYLNCLH